MSADVQQAAWDDVVAQTVRRLFLRGYDTVEIARLLSITEARAYNLLTRSRA